MMANNSYFCAFLEQSTKMSSTIKKNCWKNSSDQKDESTEEKIQTYAIIFQTDQDIKLIMIKMGIICIQKQKKRASK